MPPKLPIEPFEFQPITIEQSARIKPSARRMAIEAFKQATRPSERAGLQNPYTNTPSWSVLLQTQEGPLLLRRTDMSSRAVDLSYPEAIHPLSVELITDMFGAKPASLEVVMSDYEDGRWVNRIRRVGDFVLSMTDDQGRPYWLEYGDSDPYYNQSAVINGRPGKLIAAISGGLRSLKSRIWCDTWGEVVERTVAKELRPEANKAMSDNFKKLTIETANQLGGAYQITAPYEEGELLAPSDSRGSDTVGSIANRWIHRGYSVVSGLRKPDERTDKGLHVLTATKSTKRGIDTIVAEEGFSSLHSIGWSAVKAWQFTRGVALNHAATIDDLNLLIPR